MKKALFNWSGGKDSALCLHKVLTSGEYQVSHLITTLNKEKGRISMHGVREELLDLQAERLGLPLHKIQLPDRVSMKEYDRIMSEALDSFGRKVTHSVFGDIFLEDLRKYREQRLTKAGIEALFPLWKQSTDNLAQEFINSGFKAVVVCTDGRKLDRSFVGREYNRQFLKDLPPDIDPCGENGEFHTFVYDGPIFRKPVLFKYGDVVKCAYTVNSGDQSSCRSSISGALPEVSSHQFWFCDFTVDEQVR